MQDFDKNDDPEITTVDAPTNSVDETEEPEETEPEPEFAYGFGIVAGLNGEGFMIKELPGFVYERDPKPDDVLISLQFILNQMQNQNLAIMISTQILNMQRGKKGIIRGH